MSSIFRRVAIFLRRFRRPVLGSSQPAMRPLSATECITPTIDRTKLILFSPFRKGRSWKLCATSYVCRFGSIYLPFPLLYLAFIPAFREGGMSLLLVLAVLVIFGLALYTWIFHLCSRLQFAYFDMVANCGEFVAPAWNKYRPQALPWTGFKIIVGTVITAILAVPITAFVRHLIPLLSQMKQQQPGQADPEFMRAIGEIYGGYGVLVVALGIGMMVFGLLSDFVLPSLALENTGIKEGFRRMCALIQQEPGEFALYVLLKTVLGCVGYFGAIIMWEVAFLISTLILGGIIALIGVGLHFAGIPTTLLVAVGVVLAVAWYFFGLVYSMMFAVGSALTWIDAYAIYFLGGRYPMLGDMLDRSTPPPPVLAFDPYTAYPPPLPPTA